jgi:hypothetical protein
MGVLAIAARATRPVYTVAASICASDDAVDEPAFTPTSASPGGEGGVMAIGNDPMLPTQMLEP